MTTPRRRLSISFALLAACAAGPAWAQSASVEVNLEALGLRDTMGHADPAKPGAQPDGALVLRYPGSREATRVVPPLRYPDVPAPAARPQKAPGATTNATRNAADRGTEAPRRIPRAETPAAAPAAPRATPRPLAPATAAAAKTPSAPVQTTAPERPRAQAATAAPAVPAPAAAAPDTTPAAADTPAAAGKPVDTAAQPAGATAQPEDPRTRTAALSTPDMPARAPAPAIARIAFDPEAAAIVGPARSELDAVAEALRFDPRRIELRAYAGAPGDKSSDARRLSLKRGLAVRAYLMDRGIDARRIDVRALGGISDTGAPDRVDIAYSGG